MSPKTQAAKVSATAASTLLFGVFVVASLSNEEPDTVAMADSVESTTTTEALATTTTTTTEPPSAEQQAFSKERARASEADESVDDAFGLRDDSEAAQLVCDGPVELAFDRMLGVEHFPELVRAAYAYKCPGKVVGHDQAVLSAIGEAERRRAEEERQRAESERAAAEAQERGINSEEFAQVQNGMTVAQVEAIIGSPGEVLAETSIAGYNGLVLMWEGESGTGLGANANFQFQDGILISKAQFGL